MITLKISKLKPQNWPKQDSDRWAAAFNAPKFAAVFKPATKWASVTRLRTQDGYGTYLAWLQQRGVLDSGANPIDRVSEAYIEAFVSEYSHGRSEHMIAGTVRDIAYYFRACYPPLGVVWLTKLAHRLANSATGSRPKAPRMVSIAELLALGDSLMQKGRFQIAAGTHEGYRLYRDGLLISFLIAVPLRRKNLVELSFGTSLEQTASGFKVIIYKEKTKKHVTVETNMADWLIEPMQFYLDKVRPFLLSKSSTKTSAVWISRRGIAFDLGGMTQVICNVTKQYFGHAVSPHLFRDCAATGIAIHDPKHVGITKAVLGHATLTSSQKYYNQATSLTAVSAYQDVISKLRGD